MKKEAKQPICKVKYVICRRIAKNKLEFLLLKSQVGKQTKLTFPKPVEIYDQDSFLKKVEKSALDFVGGKEILGVPMIINDTIWLDNGTKVYYYGFLVKPEKQDFKKRRDQYWAELRKVINGLDDLMDRKAIRELNETLTMIVKETEGTKKMRRYFERIQESEGFEALIEKHQKTVFYRDFYIELARKYGIDALNFGELGRIANGEAKIDMVKLVDRVDSLRISKDKVNIYEESEIIANPLGLVLHLHASKSDIIEFLDKNWTMIEGELERHRKAKVPNIQARGSRGRYKKMAKKLKEKQAEMKKSKQKGERKQGMGRTGLDYSEAYVADNRLKKWKKNRWG